MSTQARIRGLPSAGLLSIYASFCPPIDSYENINGFTVFNGSREYNFLLLLDSIAGLLEDVDTTANVSYQLDRLSHLAQIFQSTLGELR
ncbi:hypothetical protein DICVIV_06156 [Dictyocaulus viviparus]|uniref:Uncharacterized protein n=1 Tax=Dictyocaulus viviparus TaxID=29172 RepID=A0A0D8XVA9_DICVI|nr:hypothetical protein DICVIV_06156 [Dictyocaulus viviparus]